MSAVGLALGGASLLAKAFQRHRRVNVPKMIQAFRNDRPSGYLSKEDLAFGERQRTRANETIGQGVSEGIAGAGNRLRARGITGGAAEQTFGDIEMGGNVARYRAEQGVGDLLSGRFESNLGNERAKQFDAFHASLDDAFERNRNADASDALYWNGVNSMLPSMMGALGPRAAMPDQYDAARSFDTLSHTHIGP